MREPKSEGAETPSCPSLWKVGRASALLFPCSYAYGFCFNYCFEDGLITHPFN